MERICHAFNGNPQDVMKVVWSDRRVGCSEHLTPGKGPYGGKCVPKDTNELATSSNSAFLAAVKTVNDTCTIPETKYEYAPIHVIIPTNDRPDGLDRALAFIQSQSYAPETVTVVYDFEAELQDETVKVLTKYSPCLKVQVVVNKNVTSVSGAINSGLAWLAGSNILNEHAFLALLDDDDWWDRRYLENSVKLAKETKADWIISGLVRHDDAHPQGWKQSIPSIITIDDFLTGNPNVQNSNLFVRANSLISIGGYDEALVSTTDRDVCIRLLDNKTRNAILFNHLVHHDAMTREDRLSHPGSPRKKAGLAAFYTKYGPRMRPEQKKAFKERARELFNIKIQEDGE